ncbi:MAG: hypothetical protein LUF02_11470 [Erysipelotrichaceae bacterium]|nr:hypothetical protein [Erysipelotrichaceae bacterium]
MKQNQKEKIYVLALSKIVSYIDYDINIMFDTFNKSNFEENIISIISDFENVISISKQDSRLEYGLQFIDNICSAIRLNLTENDSYYYNLLHNITKVE